MKLTLKLIVAIAAAILGVLAVATYSDVQTERDELLADVAEDHRYFARALRAFVESAWREDGAAAAIHELADANEQDRPFDIQLVSLDSTPPPGFLRPGADPRRLGPVLRGEDISFIEAEHVETYSPLHVPGRRDLAIQMSESIDAQEVFLHSAAAHAVRAGLLAALASTLLIVLLGWFFVGKPILALRAAVRRIGAGDLATRLRVQQRDEIGDLASDIDNMREKLVDARDAAANEASARVVALEALRHADRLRTVGQLAASLAHELGTPLNVVLGRARMIEQVSTAAPETREHARAIAEQSTRMSALIRQLLDFANARVPQKRVLDIRDVARDAVQMLGPLARRERIQFRLDLAAAPCPALADPSQLSQALTNLMVNAVQAMKQGGEVTVGVRLRDVDPPPELHMPRAEHVEISVQDGGPGIAKELLPRLFEPFFTTKDVGEGTGLGLSVAHGIVRDHDGFIDVESEPGRGATFRIVLPVAAPS